MKYLAAILVVALMGGCSDRDESPPPPYDAARVHRVFRPPPGEVRPVPPHAIHSDGVGPYALGTPLKAVLHQVPHGPRVVLSQIDGVVDYSLVRAEGDALIIGVGQSAGVVFVTVLDEKIARTETGVGVGTTLAQLRKAMGPAITSRDMAMDPRIEAFERLPHVRFILDRPGNMGKVIAVVVRRDAGPAAEPSADGEASQAAPFECKAADILAMHEAEIIETAHLPPRFSTSSVAHGCIAGDADALVSKDEQLVLVGGEPGKLRRLASHSVAGMIYAAPLDTDADGRHEIAIVSRHDSDEGERRWRVEILRFEAGRLQPVIAEDVFRVSAQSATWVGASLDEIEFFIELSASTGDTLQVNGFYVHRSRESADTVAPLLGTSVTIRRKRPVSPLAPPGIDSGTEPRARDAGAAHGSAPGTEKKAIPAPDKTAIPDLTPEHPQPH